MDLCRERVKHEWTGFYMKPVVKELNMIPVENNTQLKSGSNVYRNNFGYPKIHLIAYIEKFSLVAAAHYLVISNYEYLRFILIFVSLFSDFIVLLFFIASPDKIRW